MKLAEVEALFTPLADAMIARGMTLPQIYRGLAAVSIMRALEKHGGKQTKVAECLGVSPGFVSRIISGDRKAGIGKSGARAAHRANFERRYGGTPQQVLSGLEL